MENICTYVHNKEKYFIRQEIFKIIISVLQVQDKYKSAVYYLFI